MMRFTFNSPCPSPSPSTPSPLQLHPSSSSHLLLLLFRDQTQHRCLGPGERPPNHISNSEGVGERRPPPKVSQCLPITKNPSKTKDPASRWWSETPLFFPSKICLKKYWPMIFLENLQNANPLITFLKLSCKNKISLCEIWLPSCNYLLHHSVKRRRKGQQQVRETDGQKDRQRADIRVNNTNFRQPKKTPPPQPQKYTTHWSLEFRAG